MDLPKGWISRQITRLEKEYLTWPDWMRRNQKMDNFIGTWKTRNGTKVQILSVHSTGTCFTGRVLEPYISPDNEIWTDEGNHWKYADLDLMERISEKDPRR